MAGWLDSVKSTLYGGLHSSIIDLGGAECAHHIPFWVKITESVGVIIYAAIVIAWTAKKVTYVTDEDVLVMRARDIRVGSGCRSVMLMILALVFGMELSYKVVIGRLLFVMNPCHVITITQV